MNFPLRLTPQSGYVENALGKCIQRNVLKKHEKAQNVEF